MVKVDVIVPIYNRASYLKQAICSLMNQTYKDFEVIVVDDGSTEDVKSVFDICCKKYPSKLKYFYKDNGGAASARNFGIKAAKAEYVAFLDSDDEWDATYLEKVISAFDSGNYDWVATGACRIELSESDEILNQSDIGLDSFEKYNDLFSELLLKNVIGETSRVVVRKKCFDTAGVFDEDLKTRQDWELWIRLAKHGFRIVRIQEPLLLYKVRQNSTTKSNRYKGIMNGYKIYKKYKKEAFALDKKYRELYAEKFWDLGRELLVLKSNDYILFFKCIIQSQLCNPSVKRILKSTKSSMRK